MPVQSVREWLAQPFLDTAGRCRSVEPAPPSMIAATWRKSGAWICETGTSRTRRMIAEPKMNNAGDLGSPAQFCR